MYKESEDFRNFVKSIQGGKSISELFNGIAEKQSKFVRIMAKETIELAVNKFSLPKTSLKYEYNRIVTNSKTDAEIVEKHNAFMQQIGCSLRIRSSGSKSLARAEQKARTKSVEVNELADLLRITITGDLEDIRLLRKTVSKNYNFYNENWDMRNSGLLSSSFRIEVDGMVGQVLLGEQEQLFRAYPLSHKLYEAVRSYEDYAITHDKSTLKTIVDTYSFIRDSFNKASDVKGKEPSAANDNSRDVKPVVDFMKKKKINFKFNEITLDSSDKELKVALSRLNKLHQLIHIAYIDRAKESWKNFYFQKLRELNNKNSNRM